MSGKSGLEATCGHATADRFRFVAVHQFVADDSFAQSAVMSNEFIKSSEWRSLTIILPLIILPLPTRAE